MWANIAIVGACLVVLCYFLGRGKVQEGEILKGQRLDDAEPSPSIEPGVSIVPVAIRSLGEPGERPRAELSAGVAYDPQCPGSELINSHVTITGESGSGKTQAMKAMVYDLQNENIPSVILDFKDDYATDFATAEDIAVYDPAIYSLPFNPLQPIPDPVSNVVNPMSHLHGVSSIFQRVFKLGDQQTYKLRQAIKSAYQESGMGSVVDASTVTAPPFSVIQDILEARNEGALLGRLSTVFDLELFDEDQQHDMNALLDGSVIIRLARLPGDKVKNAVAEFVLMCLYGLLIRQEQPRRLTRALVLDEAWRLTHSPFLEPIMREGRSLGLGAFVSTQFPKDLPEAVAGSAGTEIMLTQSRPEQIRELQDMLLGTTQGQKANELFSSIQHLSTMEALVRNQHYLPYQQTYITPYYRKKENHADADG